VFPMLLNWDHLNIFSFKVKMTHPEKIKEVVIKCTSKSIHNRMVLNYDPEEEIFWGKGAFGDAYNTPGDFMISFELNDFGIEAPYSPLSSEEAPDSDALWWQMSPGLRETVITVEDREAHYGDTIAPGAAVDYGQLFDEEGYYSLPEVYVAGPGVEDYVLSTSFLLLEQNALTDGQHRLLLEDGSYAYMDMEELEDERRYTIYAPVNYLLPEQNLLQKQGFAAAGLMQTVKGVYSLYKKVEPGYEFASTGYEIFSNYDELARTNQQIDWLEAHHLGNGDCNGPASTMQRSAIAAMRETARGVADGKSAMAAIGYMTPGAYNSFVASTGGDIIGAFGGAFQQRHMDILNELSAFSYNECERDGDGDGDGYSCDPEDPSCEDGGGGAGAGGSISDGGDGNLVRFAHVVYKLDPSGYVFEAVEDNRLADVSATVFYQDPAGSWQPWDSEAYEEGPNPQHTDQDGRYGWDVLIGKWKVLYEKDGYHTGSSIDLDVPPPHLDVNIGLVSLMAPEVERVFTGAQGSYMQINFSRYMLNSTVNKQTVTVYYNDEMLSGSLEPFNLALSSTGSKQHLLETDIQEGLELASRFRFVPDEPLTVGETYSISISKEVVAYNGRPLAEDYQADLVVPEQAIIPLGSLVFSNDELLMLPQGQTMDLMKQLNLYPEDANDFSITWLSSRPEIAEVNASGELTGLAIGYADIIGETDAGQMVVKKIYTYRVKPAKADNDYNKIMFCRTELTVGKGCWIKAVGHREMLTGWVVDDERYVPVSWSMNDLGDSNGSWTEAPYQVQYTPTKPGKLTATVTFKLQTWNGSAWVDTGDTDVKSIQINVLPDITTGSISGTVTDANTNAPIVGATVSVGVDSSATTDVEGAYILEGIPAGTYTVTFSAESYITDTLEDVEVIAGEETEDVDMALQPEPTAGSISGTVTDAVTGEPVEGATVSLAVVDSTKTTTTVVDGTYLLEDVPAGNYTVTFSAESYITATMEDVAVIAGTETLDVDMALQLEPTTGSISGTVTDAVTGEPIEGATVSVEVDGSTKTTTTGDDGAYTLEGIPAGTYTVTFSAEDYITATTEDVAVIAGETTTDVDKALQPEPTTGSISGTVTDLNTNAPIVGATVSVEVDGSTVSATTGDNGDYLLEGIPAGAYTVTFSAEGYITATMEDIIVTAGLSTTGNDMALEAEAPAPLQIVVTYTAPYTTFPLGEGIILEATVTISDGMTPLENAEVKFYLNGETDPVSTGTTNATGVASVSIDPLPIGVYQVRALASYTVDGSTAVDETEAHIVVYDPWMIAVAFTGEQTTFPVSQRVLLEATVTSLGGMTPLENAEVKFYLNGETDPVGTGTTNAAGVASVSIDPLPIGVYQVRTLATYSSAVATADAMISIYDPAAGFVTGGGWIWSPAGAYAADPELDGKANFAFVSRYQKGRSTPDGNTQFQFRAAGLNFSSTAYEWLVIANHRAQFKGIGTINGRGNYGFMLTAIDGNLTNSQSYDSFRIKIWNADGTIVYDNQMGKRDTGNDTTALGGGSIVIHSGAPGKGR
jgi:hypothetical protein